VVECGNQKALRDSVQGQKKFTWMERMANGLNVCKWKVMQFRKSGKKNRSGLENKYGKSGIKEDIGLH